MFKKEITYFIIYFLEGNSNHKFSIYMTSNIKTTDPSAFNKTINQECISNHEINYGFKPERLMIESIQMISIQVSLFGYRIF